MIRINTEMLDPTAESKLSDDEIEVVRDAQNAGNSPKVINNDQAASGILQQTVNSEAIIAGKAGAVGGDADISGGVANLDETTDAPVEQNEYNR